jgi:formate hydrogenlyase subunit 3/multisubunit Na+/H+ antiporter MnhD subunit
VTILLAAASPALALAAVVLAAGSGALGVAVRRRPALAQGLACAALCLAAALGIAAAVLALLAPAPPALAFPWSVPGGRFAVRLDGLSALFLFPILSVPALGSVYGLRYWPQPVLGARAVRLQLLYGLTTASMALVCIADDSILFLVAWEVMALGGFALVLTEHEAAEAQRAAFVYLASAHVGSLALVALFVLLGHAAGSSAFGAMAGLPGRGALAGAVFLLALGGFGLKAGLMPLHFWLPGAHAAAPSHVSALLSGVLLKTGIYGLLRVTSFFEAPPVAWGAIVLVAGAVSAVLGVAFALAQHDLKRLLAYHSVENVGIIAMGAGLALVGRARGEPALVFLGLAGAVLHVVNHAAFKALLFFGAGAVVHATGTRKLDLLGGLAKRMPVTAALFLVGAAAISGLPPLNGFVSEWLVALAAVSTVFDRGPMPHPHFGVLAAPVLALVGALAAACFAKVFGAVFLGTGRSAHAARGAEPPRSMRVPMAALALACAAIGLFPGAVLPALTRAAADWSRLPAAALAGPAAGAASSAARVSLVAAVLLAVALGLVAWRRRGPVAAEAETWGCGYARPTARMQVTGSSFAETLVVRFGWAFFPRARVVPPRGLFPRRAAFHTSVPDTVLDVGLSPALRSAARIAGWVRAPLVSRVQFQALLLVAALVGLLAWFVLA